MRAAVFIKQVPDVHAGVVSTRPDGTIDRSSVPAVTNPADLHALEAALTVADEVVAISMGPPPAERCLRGAIAMGADSAVLITDRAFAGSDTWATANALAAAAEHLGPFDLLTCGLSAIDGETGQVGPQIAEHLGIPHATGVEAIEIGGDGLHVRRVVEGGYEVLRVPTPALVSVAETGFVPRYPTLPGRWRAASASVAHLDARDLGIGPDRVGLAASPTKVAHMESVPLPTTDCTFVGGDFSYRDLAAALVERGALLAAEPAGVRARKPLGRIRTAHTWNVWVVAEHRDGELTPGTRQLLTKANELGARLCTGVAAVVLADGDAAGLVADAGRHGAGLVCLATDPALEPYVALPHTRVLFDAISTRRPDIVLFSASTQGRDLAPRLAARLGTGLAADCTDLRIDDWSRRAESYPNLLHQVRPAMGNSVLATCVCPEARPQMATVRAGVFEAHEFDHSPELMTLPVHLRDGDRAVTVVDHRISTAAVDISDADVIVAGGAGCTEETWHLVAAVAEAIGGLVAASRGAVEAGLAPRRLQVGQTGAVVRPRLYIACGISGALQHVVGMRSAETVVAINRDPNAAIFRFADFGVVADVAEALPELTVAIHGAFDRTS